MVTDTSIRVSGFSLSGLIRRVRRSADLSQRQLARLVEVSPAAIAGYETGAITPSLAVLQRIMNTANYQLVAVDVDGRLIRPLEVWQDVCDGAQRRFPAHLDTVIDPVYGEWWADAYGLTAPPETFRRDRAVRDWQRARSRWEVRVAQLRDVPAPQPPLRRPWAWRQFP